jgi:hypothetical protein
VEGHPDAGADPDGPVPVGGYDVVEELVEAGDVGEDADDPQRWIAAQSPRAERSSSTRSVRSQVNESPLWRPKCP